MRGFSKTFFSVGAMALIIPLLLPIADAQTITNVKATPTIYRTRLFFSPANETVIADSEFEVSVFLDTQGNKINTVELNLKFPPDKVTIIKPAGPQSVIALWAAPPNYSNTDGKASFKGVIPNGITTQSGLITTITFKALISGNAPIEILPTSQVLLNDGLGSETIVSFGKGMFIIQPKPPGGVPVFSETHQFQDQWYNNNSPILSWEKTGNNTDFSYELDNKPGTIPDNVSDSSDTIKAYENLADGIWYFHLKARKEGIWGATTHFILRIDTTPPAAFTPKAEFLTAVILPRALVSFFTTDSLSGIDHYEVGVIDKNDAPTKSPAFVQAESPYQLPIIISQDLRVIVRAIDRANNIRDESIDVHVPTSILLFFKNHLIGLLIALLILIGGILPLHYIFGHHIIRKFKQIFKIIEEDDSQNINVPPPSINSPSEYQNFENQNNQNQEDQNIPPSPPPQQ